jgi:uncharacterized protein (DUF2267 family)
VRATLQTLGERLSAGEARDLADYLPPGAAAWLAAERRSEPWHLDEFLRRVAERADVDRARTAELARAVFAVLGEAIAPGEMRDIARQLPAEFDPLLEAAGAGLQRIREGEDVVLRLVIRTGLDRDKARRAVDAVLVTLAERISDGEVADLEAELPRNLRPALERGLYESRAAKPMSLDEFVARVAERDGAGRDEAEQHVRAVFAMLRELLSDKEVADVMAQLSREYAPLLAAS